MFARVCWGVALGLVLLLQLGAATPSSSESGEGRSFSDKVAAFAQGSDLPVFWSSVQLLIEDRDPYDSESLAALQEHLGRDPRIEGFGYWHRMWYPPWALAWMFPVLAWSFPVSSVLWLILTGVGIMIAIALPERRLSGQKGLSLGTAFAALLLISPALSAALGRLQTAPVLVGALCVMLYALGAKRNFLAGAASVFLAAKPHLFLPFALALAFTLVRDRRFLFFYGFGVFFAASCLLVLAFRPDIFQLWSASLASPPLFQQSADLAGMLRWYLAADGSVKWPAYVGPAVASAGAVIWSLSHRSPAEVLELATPLLCLSLLFAPYSHQPDHLLLLPSAVSLAQSARRSGYNSPFAILFALATAGVFLIGVLELFPSEVSLFWYPLLILLLWYLERRFRS